MAFNTRLIALIAVGCFAVTSIVFSLLGITSGHWVARDYYDSAVPEDWIRPNITLFRSPFSICTATANTVTDLDDEGILHSSLQSYNFTCYKYKPFGVDHTSCELPSTLRKYLNINDTLAAHVATRGDIRLCQQIHFAGNFGISGTVFVSLGSLVALGLALFATTRPGSNFSSSKSRTTYSTVQKGQQESYGNGGGDDATGEGHHRPADDAVYQSPEAYVNFTTITLLCIGAILTLISQFYGIIALTQSAPNNSDFASSAYGTSSAEDPNVAGFHGPWYQSKGLSVYMTCAWAFALATAALAKTTWATPRWWVKYQ